MSSLPLIVGYGGINAAGRSIFDFSHRRMLFHSINSENQNEVLQSLGHLMGTSEKQKILNKMDYKKSNIIKTDGVIRRIYEDIDNEDAIQLICHKGGARTIFLTNK